jgi:outer membrane lipoprotein-sorting protein
MLGILATPARDVHAAQPGRQSSGAPVVPFSGTATISYSGSESVVPTKARNDLLTSKQDETFSVRDETHWRVGVHVATPIIDSQDQTFVANGNRVVEYSSLFNQAFRFSNGLAQSGFLLSSLLRSNGAPLGATTAQYIQLATQNPKTKVKSLGQVQVAGRTADVLQISPLGFVNTGSCSGPKDCAKKEKGFGSATIWLDHEHGITLRYEQHGTLNIPGAQKLYRYEVTSITFGQGPSDADLAYVPPVPSKNAPQNGIAQSSSGGGGGGPGAKFQAPPGLISVRNPVSHGVPMSAVGFGYGSEGINGGSTYAEALFRGSPSAGFVYLKERIRALGLPPALTTGSAQMAASCQVWTGTFSDGLTWLAMQRGKIAILVVSNTLTQPKLVQYATNRICPAPTVPPPSAEAVLDTTLDHLEAEIDITRQILGWAIAAAPSAADKRTLGSFDVRLQAFDRSVFALRHRGDPQAVYSSPGFPPVQHHAFKDTLAGLLGEIPAAENQLTQAEAAVKIPADRQTLKQQGAVLQELVHAVKGM